MSRHLFGTDGVRGRANSEPMTAEIAMRIGMAAGQVFNRGDHRHRVVIGTDTRLSGYMIEQAMTAGFLSVGMDVLLLGPVPTPAVGFLTRSMRADVGVMISASHNPYEDNGIKLFGPDGFKLSDAVEAQIEALVATPRDIRLASSKLIGRAKRIDDADGRYIEAVKASVRGNLDLAGLKIVVDCANGAAYKVAPSALWELGADVFSIGVEPNGLNINEDVGSTSPEAMIAKVKETRADFGIALDGDADRVVMCDERGRIIDGDQILALIARSWAKTGELKGGGVVGTVMSNIGLERFLKSQNLKLVRAPVGDRYVIEKMREGGFNVGGEQSGHIIFSDFITTGDGLIAALQVLAVLAEDRRPASEAVRIFEPAPQVLENVRFTNGSPLSNPKVASAIKLCEQKLDGGRLLVRKSGTEPVIRIMAEGENEKLVRDVVKEVAQLIREAVS